MKTSIIKIGNSRGIRIPKAILESSKLNKDVILTLKKDGSVVISPAPGKQTIYGDEYLASLPSLDDWNDPREDKAWAHLQAEQ